MSRYGYMGSSWVDIAARLPSWCEDCKSIVPPRKECRCQLPDVEVAAGQTCPLCRDVVVSSEALDKCQECSAVCHNSCLGELGRNMCPTLGCSGRMSA